MLSLFHFFSFQDGLHANNIILKYDHNGKNVIIDLLINYDLIPEGHYISYQTPDGGKVVKKFTKTELNLCHYHASISFMSLILLCK